MKLTMPRALKSVPLAGIALCFAGAAFAEQITVASYGGVTEKTLRSAWFEPYTAETGVEVGLDTWGGELAKLRVMVESGNIVWDMLDMEQQGVETACAEGLLERVGDDPRFKEAGLIDGALIECGVGQTTYATILAYNPDSYATAPTSLTDLFDTATFPGKRGLRKSPVDNLELALLADGVALKDIYEVLSTPEGVDRALSKLDTIKDDIVWWEAGAQPAQLLTSGEVKMSTAWNARIAVANSQENANLGMVWGDHVAALGFWGIPKGNARAEQVKQLIAYTLRPDVNAKYSDYQPYGPVVEAARKNVKPEVLPNLPTGHADSDKIVQDGSFWAQNGETLNAQFFSWLAE